MSTPPPLPLSLVALKRYGWPPMDEIVTWDALYVPQTFKGFSSFFGVAVFSYGATIIILEIQVRI